ncbi:MAG: hypothetical protein LBV46_01160 [Bacteroidales bacterium]|nr:hypothetical protein [Bacteroidales bacterium]
MKKLIIVTLMFVSIQFSYAQEFTHEVDSATSELILRHFIKWRFARNIFMSKLIDGINPERYYYPQYKQGQYSGARYINEYTYALGDWAMKPDFKIYKSYHKSPWKGYELYQLNIPNHSPRNDSITRYFAYRDRGFARYDPVPEFYDNPIESLELIAYNPQTGDFKLTDSRFRMPLTKEHDDGLLSQLNPEYKPTFDYGGYKMLLLVPENRDRIGIMLKSELMKNIYAYRLLKSGVLDSLADGRYLREDKYLFPLIDSLLPTFDDDLLMKADWIEDNYEMSIWRFYYPGVDMVRKTSSRADLLKSYTQKTVWERYFPLEPTVYAVAYEPRRQIVHFIAGKNIFLTRMAATLFPDQDKIYDPPLVIDSLIASKLRIEFIQMKTMNMFPGHYWFYEGFESLGEDSLYWYYKIYGETPIILLRNVDSNLLDDPYAPPIRALVIKDKVKKCYYKIRMSKENYDLIDILEELDCTEGYHFAP